MMSMYQSALVNRPQIPLAHSTKGQVRRAWQATRRTNQVLALVARLDNQKRVAPLQNSGDVVQHPG